MSAFRRSGGVSAEEASADLQRSVGVMSREQLGSETCWPLAEGVLQAAHAFLDRPAKSLQGSREALLAARNLRQRVGAVYGGLVPMTTRRRVLENAADVFHYQALLRLGVVTNVLTANETGRQHCLRQLFDDLGAYVFENARACDIDSPPPEMFSRITFEELWSQYIRLQEFAGKLVSDGAATRLAGVEVRFPTGNCCVVPLSSLLLAGQRRDQSALLRDAASRLQKGERAAGNALIGATFRVRKRCHSAVGLLGSGVVAKVVYVVSDNGLYEAIVQTPYALVQLRSIWHIVCLYHHCQMRCMCTQTMCESANSALRLLERRNSIGRTLSVQALVESTRLRCAGVRGDRSDEALLWRALLRLFDVRQGQSELPFFFASKRTQSQKLLLGGPTRKDSAVCYFR